MRFMVLVKGDEGYERGEMPSEEILAEMSKYNEELADAGVMLEGEGLAPTSKGARIAFSGSDRNVIEGPFGDTTNLLAGYWLIQTKSLDEAIDWIKRAPFQEGEVEIRQVFETEDFGDELTPELREKEERIREKVAENK